MPLPAPIWTKLAAFGTQSFGANHEHNASRTRYHVKSASRGSRRQANGHPDCNAPNRQCSRRRSVSSSGSTRRDSARSARLGNTARQCGSKRGVLLFLLKLLKLLCTERRRLLTLRCGALGKEWQRQVALPKLRKPCATLPRQATTCKGRGGVWYYVEGPECYYRWGAQLPLQQRSVLPRLQSNESSVLQPGLPSSPASVTCPPDQPPQPPRGAVAARQEFSQCTMTVALFLACMAPILIDSERPAECAAMRPNLQSATLRNGLGSDVIGGKVFQRGGQLGL